jgi:hypothetical protein
MARGKQMNDQSPNDLIASLQAAVNQWQDLAHENAKERDEAYAGWGKAKLAKERALDELSNLIEIFDDIHDELLNSNGMADIFVPESARKLLRDTDTEE